MADTPQPERNYREDVLKALDGFDKFSTISQALKTSQRTEASKELLKSGLEAALSSGRYTQAQIDGLQEQERLEVAQHEFPVRQMQHYETAANLLTQNPDKIFQVDGKYEPKLAKLVANPAILEEIIEKERPIADAYVSFAELSKVIDEMKKGKMSPKLKEYLTKVASQGAYESEAERMRKVGYSIELCDLAGKAATFAITTLQTSDQLEKGAKAMRDKERKKAEKLAGAEDLEQVVARSVSTALGKMLKSGNPKKEQEVVGGYFEALKGYNLGERGYSEVFKPKTPEN